ncbi:MAG: hypothetical protein HEQ40_12055 [Lacibacter sp.]|jgi:hypothetical protein
MNTLEEIRKLNASGFYVIETTIEPGSHFAEIRSVENILLALGLKLNMDLDDSIHFGKYFAQFHTYYKEKNIKEHFWPESEGYYFLFTDTSLWCIPSSQVNPVANRENRFDLFRNKLEKLALEIGIKSKKNADQIKNENNELNQKVKETEAANESLKNRIKYLETQNRELTEKKDFLLKMNWHLSDKLGTFLKHTLNPIQLDIINKISINLIEYGVKDYLDKSDSYEIQYHVYEPAILLKITVKKPETWDDQLQIDVPRDYYFKVSESGDIEKVTFMKVQEDLKNYLKIKKLPILINECGFFRLSF